MAKKKDFTGITMFAQKSQPPKDDAPSIVPSHPIQDMTFQIREEIRNLKLDLIDPDPAQTRKYFKEEALKDLAESIKEKGVLHPIIVVREGDLYRIRAGERRWRASQLAGKETIPAIVKKHDLDITEISLIENVQREGLSPIEESLAIKNLIDEKGYRQKEVAALMGAKVTEAYISQAVKIARFAETYGDIKYLASLEGNNGNSLEREKFLQVASMPTVEDGIALLNAIIDGKMTVRQIRKTNPASKQWNAIRVVKHLHSFSDKLHFDFIPNAKIEGSDKEKVLEAIGRTVEQLKNAATELENVKDRLISSAE